MKIITLLCCLFCATLSLAADQPGKSDALIEALKKATASANPHVRAAAARALGDIGGSSAKAQLIELLKDKNEFVSTAAAEALAKSGDKSTSRALIQIVITESANFTVTNSGTIFSPSFTNRQVVIENESEELAVSAIHALGDMKDTNAVGVITATLDSPRIGLRIAAAMALGRLKDRSATKPLLHILEEYYWTTPKVEGVIQSDTTLANMQQAKESNAYLRSAVVWALGEIGDPSAKPTLKRATEDDNSIVRDTAMEALDKVSN